MQYYSLKDYGIAGKTKDAPDTTAVNVVASAYDTSGSGGRKIVRLSNGWIVAGALNQADWTLRFYVSKDNGTTFTALTTISGIANSGLLFLAIASSGTTVYALTGVSVGMPVFYKFDATTVGTSISSGAIIPDTVQTATEGVSLCIDGTGALHAAWATKNSTYANSFNIRYSKSTDGGATWAAPTQITVVNASSTYGHINPCIVVRSNNLPTILATFDNTQNGQNAIRVYNFNGSSWVNSTNYPANIMATYTQANPCMAVDSNDTIHVVWDALDATDYDYRNVRYSRSTDGGMTWTAATKLTTGNLYHRTNASITIDKNNKLYVFFHGYDAAINIAYNNVMRVIYDGKAWGTVTTLTKKTTDHAQDAQTIWSKFNMNSDDAVRWIWREPQAAAVKYDASPRPKVEDIPGPVPEIYIPLWWNSGGAASTTGTASGYRIQKGTEGLSTVAGTTVQLHTLNANWSATLKYAFEVSMYNANTGLTTTTGLWDWTTNTAVVGSNMTTTAGSMTTVRSGQLTLVPGHVYGIYLYTSNSNYQAFLTDASLIVFPS